jgi:hypothetical protein
MTMPHTLRDQLIAAQEARNEARRQRTLAIVRFQEAQTRIEELEVTVATLQAALVRSAEYLEWREQASHEDISQQDESNRIAIKALLEDALASTSGPERLA